MDVKKLIFTTKLDRTQGILCKIIIDARRLMLKALKKLIRSFKNVVVRLGTFLFAIALWRFFLRCIVFEALKVFCFFNSVELLLVRVFGRAFV